MGAVKLELRAQSEVLIQCCRKRATRRICASMLGMQAQAAALGTGAHQLRPLCASRAPVALSQHRTLPGVFQNCAGPCSRWQQEWRRTMALVLNPKRHLWPRGHRFWPLLCIFTCTGSSAGTDLSGACPGATGNLSLPCSGLLLPPSGLRTQPCCTGLAVLELLRTGL